MEFINRLKNSPTNDNRRIDTDMEPIELQCKQNENNLLWNNNRGIDQEYIDQE